MHRRLPLILAGAAALLVGCASDGSSAPPSDATTRTWQMGFGFVPPRLTTAAVLQGIDLWSLRAEIGAIHEEIPWRDLLSGQSPDAILDRDKVQLVNYMRGKGLKIYFMADITDGLDRAQEAPQLRSLGRSLAEPVVQQAYRNYVLAVARKLNPEFLGLAAETNLIRQAAPAALYAAVVRAASDANADLRAAGALATILTTVQVETAWGVLGGNRQYAGIERDFADFPFTQILGLSSYPYFSYAQPEDIPNDYYSRLLNGRSLPVMVVEGGWTTASAGAVTSTRELQARYVNRHAALLDSVRARAVVQLVFADLDLLTYPQPLPPNLPLFASIGLAGSDFTAKPALAAWDALFARRRSSP
jgi:hypothetical protein